jgi:hypothetical protein
MLELAFSNRQSQISVTSACSGACAEAAEPKRSKKSMLEVNRWLFELCEWPRKIQEASTMIGLFDGHDGEAIATTRTYCRFEPRP